MNTSRITSAAREIERLQLALKWLEEFGPKITDSERAEYADVRVKMNFAGSCLGGIEVGEILSEMIGNRIPDLMAEALTNCRNTIEIHRQTIRDEATQ